MSRRTFVIVSLVLCLLPLVGRAPLLDPDDGLHAAIAQEMARGGDYVTPRFLGEPFLDKPILFFWAEAVSLRIFGMHEAAVRLPSVFFTLLGMIGVALLGRAMLDESTGLIAGAVYGTMLLPAAMANLAVHDVALPPFLCLAALHLWKSETRGAISAGVIVGMCFGVSILTKGLAGIVFAGIFAACLAAVRPAAIPRLIVVLSIGAVVGVLVAVPWYAAMERAHPGYLHYYFVERHLRGYLTATQRHAMRPWWYYLPVLAGAALPWIGYAAMSVRKLAVSGARRAMAAQPALFVVWAWFAISLLFLSVGQSKLVTYALPTLPALALACAACLRAGDDNGAWSRAAIIVHGLTTMVLPIVAIAAIASRFGAVPAVLWMTGGGTAFVVLVVLASGQWVTADRPPLGRMMAATIVALGFVMLVAAPYGGRWMTGKDLAAALNESGMLPPRVSIFDERIGSVVFYLSPELRRQASTTRIIDTSLPDAIRRAESDPPDGVLAVRDRNLGRLTRLFKRPVEPDIRAGTYLVYRNDTLRRALE